MKNFVFKCFPCRYKLNYTSNLHHKLILRWSFFRCPTNYFIPGCIKRTFDREGQCGLGNILGRSLLSGCQESWNNKRQRVHSKGKTKHTQETVRFFKERVLFVIVED